MILKISVFHSFFFYFAYVQRNLCQNCDVFSNNSINNSETCYDSYNLSSIILTLLNNSILNINSRNEVFFIEETISIMANIMIMSQGNNNSLVFSEDSGLVSNIQYVTFQIVNLVIVFKCENPMRINTFFSFSNETTLIFRNCTFQVINVISFDLNYIIQADNSNINIEGVSFESNVLINATTFLASNTSNIIILDFYCEQIEFYQNFFSLMNSNASLKNLTILSNFFFSNFIYAFNYFQSQFLIEFNISNSTFSQNVFDSEGIILIGLQNVTIQDSYFYFNNFSLLFEISNTENVLFQNSKFSNNEGGLIKVENVILLEFYLLFIKNCQSNNNFTVFLLNSINQIMIISCLFEQNQGIYSVDDGLSNGYSAVIYLDNTNLDSSYVIIEQSIFLGNQGILDNSSEVSGCGTFLMETGTIEIKNSSFESNVASHWTICLEIRADEISIIECSFVNNSYLKVTDDPENMIAGTILADFNNFTLSFSNFSLNQADDGTCLLIYQGSAFQSQNFWGYSLNFIGNIAYDSTNIFYVSGDTLERIFVFENSYFSNGISQSGSGLFFFETIPGDFFQNYSFYNCFFSKNQGASDGSFFDHYPSDPINCFIYIEDSYFINNTVSGAAISNSEGIIFDVWGEFLDVSDLSIYAIETKNCHFSGNYASTGAVINANRIIYYDEGSTFEDNEAFTEGGAILVTKGVIILNNSFFINCTSSLVGGALSLREESMAVILYNHISNCFSIKGSFANVDMYSAIYINHSYFEKCNGMIGSLIFLSNGFQTEAVILSSQFYNNSCEEFLIYSENSNFTLQNSTFNLSSNIGIFLNCFIVFENLLVENILCFFSLGCVLAIYDDSFAILNNFNVINMTTMTTGGIFYVESSTIGLNSSNFVNLFSNGSGTFIYGISSDISIYDLEINNFKYDLMYYTKCSISLQDSIISNNFSKVYLKTSALFFDECLTILIANSKFFNINTQQNGSHIMMSSESIHTNYEIYDSYFSYSQANFSGGSIYHFNSIGFIQNCSFIMNSAEIGGALNFFCNDFNEANCSLTLMNNLFESNVGTIEGGAIKWNKISPKNLSTNIFLNNLGKEYGNNFANEPMRFGLNIYINDTPFLIYSENQTFFQNGAFLQDVISGDVTEYKFELFLLDQTNEIFKVFLDESVKLDLINNATAYVNKSWLETLENTINYEKSDLFDGNISEIYGSTTIYSNENNSFIFENLIFVGTPNTFIFLKLSSQIFTEFYPYMQSIFPNEIPDPSLPNQPYIFILPIFLTMCTLGEVYNETENTCNECPIGKFTFDANAKICYDCLPNSICNGGSDVYIQKDFWRSGKYSINIYQCDSIDICLGGIGTECAPNYKGIKCEECDLNVAGEFTKKDVFGECSPCILSQQNIWLNILFIFLIISLFVLLIWFFISKNVSEEKKVLLKILINYFQFIYLLPVKNALLLKNQRNYQWVSRYIVGFADLFSLDCFYVNFGFNGQYLQGLSIFNELSLIMIVVIACIFLISMFWRIKQRKYKENYHLENNLSFHVFSYVIFPFLSLTSISPLNCISIDDVLFVEDDLTTKCWDSDYLVGIFCLSFPNLVFWLAIFPYLIFKNEKRRVGKFGEPIFSFENSDSLSKVSPGTSKKIIFLKKMKCNDKEVKSIFFIGYKNTHPGYERLIYFKKIIFIVLAGIYERSRFRIIISSLVYNVAFIHFFSNYPMMSKNLNKIESFHLLVHCCNYYLLVFNVVDLDINSMILFYSFTLISNVSLLIIVALNMLQIVRLRNIFKNIISKITNKFIM